MLKIENFSYGYPQKDLYHNISFTLEKGQHCAFIGVSGSGKSTLTDIIMHPDDFMYEGTLDIDTPCRIGYVSQFVDTAATEGLTVFDYIAEPFVTLQQALEALCVAMETGENLEALLEQYQETLDAYDAVGGDNYESMILRKLNLAELAKLQDLHISALSGGEFKLVQVIREMLTNPDLLIMDYPDVF